MYHKFQGVYRRYKRAIFGVGCTLGISYGLFRQKKLFELFQKESLDISNTKKDDVQMIEHYYKELQMKIDETNHFISNNSLQIRNLLNSLNYFRMIRHNVTQLKLLNSIKNYCNCLSDHYHLILNSTEQYLHSNKRKSSSSNSLDFNIINNHIFNIYSLSQRLNCPSKIKESIFDSFKEISLRLLSDSAIFNHSLSKEIKQKMIDYANNIIQSKSSLLNETLLYSSYKLLNNLNKKKEYITDNIVLLNHKQKNQFDYDIIMISGLNAHYIRSWRIQNKHTDRPHKESVILSLLHKLKYILFNRGLENIFYRPSYHCWIHSLLEKKMFKSYNIRYITALIETKFFKNELKSHNIEDLSIDEISKRLINDFKRINVGKKPIIFICHSMGGLIVKNIISKLSEDKRRMVKGVIFFSTPHYGCHTMMDSIINSVARRLFHITRSLMENIAPCENALTINDLAFQLQDVQLSKAAEELCLKPKKEYVKEHEAFKKYDIKYICIDETRKTMIRQINDYIMFVDPQSSIKHSDNHRLLVEKNHYTIQKFSGLNDKSFIYMTSFIKKRFKLL